MVKCSNCNNEVRNGNFCGKCGAKLRDDVKTSVIEVPSKNNENSEKNSKFCYNCGEKININAVICPKCGVKIVNLNKKSPILSVILSFFVVGLGQVYNGQIKRGILLFIVAIIFAMLSHIFIGAILLFILWVYGMYDGYKTAQKINDDRI